MNIFLLIFLLANAFLMGFLAAVAWRHARAHFRPHLHDADIHHPAKGVRLPPDVKQQMLEESQQKFLQVLEESAKELQKDLHDTAQDLHKNFEGLGTQVTESETQRYQTMLEELRKHTEQVVGNVKDEISGHEDELKSKLAEAIAAEQQRLLQQIDTKLADAVAAFLVETLQHNVDLGAQTSYLTKMLEEHKDDFKRRVVDETGETTATK